MKFNDIYPFVRFAARQNFSREILFLRTNIVSFDHRIFYCIKGKGTLYIDNREFPLEPYSFVLWQSGHTYKAIPEEGEDFVVMTCNFDYTNKNSHIVTPIVPSSEQKFKIDAILEKVEFDDFEAFNDIIYIKFLPQVNELLASIVDIYKDNLNHSQIKLRSALLQVLILTASYINDLLSNSYGAIISDVIKYIQQNYKKKISNTQIAESFSYHPNYLSNLFQKETGYSLYNYITRYRLSKAYGLLMNTNMPINRICDEVNLPNCHYFSRVFKKYYGTSPQKIRKSTH
jgi:YesN/AraC family two-component response regulator